MGGRNNLAASFIIFSAIIIAICNTLPTSLLESTKSINIRTNKVKRNPENAFRSSQTHLGESNPGAPITYYGNPTAKKRGANIKDNADITNVDIPSWEQAEEALLERQQQQDALRNLSPEMFSTSDDPLNEKSLTEYEKGFHYGTNKAKMDEQMENAVLKTELYGDPSAMNQYRYYGREDKRRKRSSNKRLTNRFKREIELSPEDVLALLSLWEAERQHNPNYGHNSRMYNNQDLETIDLPDDDDVEESDENWLETPVYPGAHSTGHLSRMSSQSPYYYETKDYQPQTYNKRQWAGFGERNKRFMVSRKRSDPTRELRYFTGPNHLRNSDDNIYTLSQLLGGPAQQRDPNIPLYRRVML